MAKKAELRAVLSLNNVQFLRNIKQAMGQAKALAAQFRNAPIRTTALAGLLTARAGIKGIASGVQGIGRASAAGFGALADAAREAGVFLVHGVRNAIELGAGLDDMSKKTGVAADKLMILQEAARAHGVEGLGGALKKMQKNIKEAAGDGASHAAKALDKLGLSARDLARDTPDVALQRIGERINALQDPSQRAAEAIAIFGKSGTQMLALFADQGALGTAASAIGRQAVLLKQNSAAFHEVSVSLSRSGLKLQGFFVGVASKVIPLILAATKRFDALGIDLAGVGEKLGDGIRTAVNVLAGAFANPGAITEPLMNGLKAGFAEAGNVLVAVLKSAVGVLTDVATWSALGLAFKGLGEIVSGELMKAFSGATNYLRDAVQFAMEGGIALWEKAVDKLTPGGSKEHNDQQARWDAAWQKSQDTGRPMNFTERVIGTSRTMAQIRKANEGMDDIGGDTVAAGHADLASAARAASEALQDAAKNFKTVDVFGARGFWDAATREVVALAAAGKPIVDKAVSDSAPKKTMDAVKEYASKLRTGKLQTSSMASPDFGSLFANTRQNGAMYMGGLTGSMLDGGAHGQTPLIRARRLRIIQSASRAQYMAEHNGATPDGVTRHGDRKMMRDFQRKKQEEKLGIETSNTLLHDIKIATESLSEEIS